MTASERRQLLITLQTERRKGVEALARLLDQADISDTADEATHARPKRIAAGADRR